MSAQTKPDYNLTPDSLQSAFIYSYPILIFSTSQ